MRESLLSFIGNHKVIDKIIRHLKLAFHAERPPPPQVVQQELLMAAEEREEYFLWGFLAALCRFVGCSLSYSRLSGSFRCFVSLFSC